MGFDRGNGRSLVGIRVCLWVSRLISLIGKALGGFNVIVPHPYEVTSAVIASSMGNLDARVLYS